MNTPNDAAVLAERVAELERKNAELQQLVDTAAAAISSQTNLYFNMLDRSIRARRVFNALEAQPGVQTGFAIEAALDGDRDWLRRYRPDLLAAYDGEAPLDLVVDGALRAPERELLAALFWMVFEYRETRTLRFDDSEVLVHQTSTSAHDEALRLLMHYGLAREHRSSVSDPRPSGIYLNTTKAWQITGAQPADPG